MWWLLVIPYALCAAFAVGFFGKLDEAAYPNPTDQLPALARLGVGLFWPLVVMIFVGIWAADTISTRDAKAELEG